MIWEPEVKLTIAISDDATVAVLAMTNGDDETRTFVGAAKKHPRDAVSVEIGTTYATGRALIRAGEDFVDIADRLVEEGNKSESIVAFGELVESILDKKIWEA